MSRKKIKKGILFSMDALFASMLLIAALLLLIESSYIKEISNQGISYASNDIMNSFSNIQMNQINNTYIKQLIQNDIINNTDNTIIEQIGEFYVLNMSDYAENISKELSEKLIPKNYGFSIIVNDEEVYENNISLTSDLATSRRLISGIEKFKPIKGATSKVYLSGINNKKDISYTYFGGFIGQGNISVSNNETPDDADFLSMEIKGVFGGNFSLYINGNPLCKTINNSIDQLTPDSYNISSCIDDLEEGKVNNFTFITNSDLMDSYIAGGYIKISYYTNNMIYATENEIIRYYLSDIEGIINIYDSVYTPGTVNSMKVYLHYISSSHTYLNIGGVHVYENYDNGSLKMKIINNSILSSKLNNYNSLHNTTIPIRMASYNMTTILSNISDVDIVLITDYSESMKNNYLNTDNGNSNVGDCPDEVLADPDLRKTFHAKCLNNIFLDIFGNVSGARIWPVNIHDNTIDSYSGIPYTPDYLGDINAYANNPSQGKQDTCMACAFNAAYDIFKANNESNRTKYIIFMTDGMPTHYPDNNIFSLSSNYSSTQTCGETCDGGGACNIATEDGCSNGLCNDAMISTKFALNRSVTDFNVTLYSIGFGNISACSNAVTFLQDLATLSINGSYNTSTNLEEMKIIYEDIAYKILETANQIAQLVNTTNITTSGHLYGDSYIEFNITPSFTPAGSAEIEIVIEDPLDNCIDNISIPNDIRILEGNYVSYSGIHWTNKLIVNSNQAFFLDDFFPPPYYALGDPFNIHISNTFLNSGTNNFNITLADNPNNLSTDCSNNNSFIYKGAIKSEVSYSDVLENVIGCNWTIDYEFGGQGNFLVPPEYAGAKTCEYRNSSISYDVNDTYDDAMYNLMNQLDFDDDGRIFVNLDENNLIINSISILKVPYPWGPTIAEVRIWK